MLALCVLLTAPERSMLYWYCLVVAQELCLFLWWVCCCAGRQRHADQVGATFNLGWLQLPFQRFIKQQQAMVAMFPTFMQQQVVAQSAVLESQLGHLAEPPSPSPPSLPTHHCWHHCFCYLVMMGRKSHLVKAEPLVVCFFCHGNDCHDLRPLVVCMMRVVGIPRDGDDPGGVWTAHAGFKATAKVADFGLAFPLDPNNSHATLTARVSSWGGCLHGQQPASQPASSTRRESVVHQHCDWITACRCSSVCAAVVQSALLIRIIFACSGRDHLAPGLG
jgi:hypothetical protein